MITIERKGKNKHKVLVSPRHVEQHSLNQWCAEQFGPGGRHKRCLWRHGWTDTANTYYFKNEQDATLFMLRWS